VIIKRNIKFYVRRSLKRSPIRMIVNFNCISVEFYTGIIVTPNYWNYTKQRIMPKYKEKNNFVAAKYNNVLATYETIIEDIFNKYELVEKRIPTVMELRKDFFSRIDKKDKLNKYSFFSIFDEFLISEKVNKNWSDKTFKRLQSVRNNLYMFNPKITFEALEKDIIKYMDFLNQKGYRSSTIAKEYNILDWFLGWAKTKKYYTGNIEMPKVKQKDTKEIVYLTIEELKRIEQYQSDNVTAMLAKDMFLLSCYTGLRYSDIIRLRWEDIIEDSIHIIAQKTGKVTSINLNKNSISVLNRHKDKDPIFPAMANGTLNLYLKQIGKECQINAIQHVSYFKYNKKYEKTFPKHELLSIHCGRRTFIITALTLGISENVIMKWTGHSNFNSMKPYHKIVDELKKREVLKFDNLFG